MKNLTKLLLYNFEQEQNFLKEITQGLPEEVEIINISTPIELRLFLQSNINVFMISQINSESDVSEIGGILNKLKKRIKGNNISLNYRLKLKTQNTIRLINEIGSENIYEETTRTEIYKNDIVEHTQEKDSEKQEDYVTYVSNQKGFKQINLESGVLKVFIKKSDKSEHSVRLEHFENELIEIETTTETEIATGENCEVLIIFMYARCKIEINLKGVVKNNEANHGSRYISITTERDEEIDLDKFFDTYQMRQKSINDFISLARGY
jgi:hypothetical protein